MANVGIYNLTDTWTDAGTTYNGIKINVTNTASAAASKVLDLQVGGSSVASVDPSGTILATDVYGCMSTQGNAVAETTVDATPRKITSWNNNGASNDMTVDHTDDTILATVAGTYMVWVSASFSGTGNSTYDLEIYLYDDSGASWSASGFALKRKLGTGGDVGNSGVVGIVTLDVSDKVALYQSTADGSALTVAEAQLICRRVGA